MRTISIRDVRAVIDMINQLTDSPAKPYTRDEGGKFTANVGNYHLSEAYGGYSLHRMAQGGGIHDVFYCGHTTKRELYYRMQAFISGLERREA